MTARRVPTSLQFFRRLRWIDGSPLWDKIEPYRRRIFTEALDAKNGRGQPQYNLALTGRAKKNWKSADLILAAIYRLLAWDSPGGHQCYLLANDEGQAADDLDLAMKLIRANPVLDAACTIKAKEVTRKDGRGNMMILPAKDVAGAHGKTYLFCGLDEIHAYRDWALLEAMQLDPTRPDAMMWITSYASLHHRPGFPLYDLIERGKASADPRMFFSWYAADFTTDPAFAEASAEDRANPSRSSWEDTTYLEQQRSRLPTVRFRRLHLNLPGYPDGGAFDPVKLDSAVLRGVRSQPPSDGTRYFAFADMSGGSSDASVISIGHVEGKQRVVDLTLDQGVKPPFDPRAVIPRFAKVLAAYRISAVTADTFGKEMLNFRQDFEQAGISYRSCPLSASELFEAFEVPLNTGEIVLPDDPETREQFAGLQRRGGKIGHRSGEHDDRANAVAGLCWLLGDAARVSYSPDAIQLGCLRAGIMGARDRPSQDWVDVVQESAKHGGAFAKGRRALSDWY